jgi:hypothetical protein
MCYRCGFHQRTFHKKLMACIKSLVRRVVRFPSPFLCNIIGSYVRGYCFDRHTVAVAGKVRGKISLQYCLGLTTTILL